MPHVKMRMSLQNPILPPKIFMEDVLSRSCCPDSSGLARVRSQSWTRFIGLGRKWAVGHGDHLWINGPLLALLGIVTHGSPVLGSSKA